MIRPQGVVFRGFGVVAPALAAVLAVDPVGAVEPESSRNPVWQNRCRPPSRRRARRAAMPQALAVEVELLRLHVDVLAVAGEQVGVGHRHVLLRDQRLQVLAGLAGRSRPSRSPRAACAGGRVEPHQAQAAVEEHVAAGQAVDHVVVDQHAAADRPGRLDLLVGDDPLVARVRRGSARPAAPSSARRQ